jgi:rhodanese-related sulfurtransferase
MNIRIILLGVAILAAQAGCSTNQSGAAASATAMSTAPVAAQNGPFVDITVPQYQAMSEGADFFVVNVHVPFEGDLPGTDASIAFDQIQNHLDQLPSAKGARILLYCKSGRMSIEAARKLNELGYTAVYNLAGGMNAWTAAGNTLASAQ